MELASMMTRDPATIPPGATLDEAIDCMDRFEIRHLPVVEDGHLVGLVSDRDLLEATGWLPARVRDMYQGPHVSRSCCVRDVMQVGATHLAPVDSIDALFAVASAARLECVPVVESGKLVGILTERDVLAAFVEECRSADTEPSSIDDPEVERLMSRDPIVLEVGASLAQAREAMAAVGAHHLPVVQSGTVVGILSDRDLRRAVGRGRKGDYDIRELMSRGVIDTAPSARLSAAAASMLAGHFSSLPIVQKGNLVGILTMTDAMGPCLKALRSTRASA